MKKVMRLDSILESLDDTTEKVAADHSTTASNETSVDATKKELLASLQSDTTDTEKTAEVVATPEGDLEKIAADIAQAEEESIVKEAQLYGAAVCDGFMQRMGMYEKAAEDVSGQEVQTVPLEDFHKVAHTHYHDETGTVYTRDEVEHALQEENTGHEKLAHDSFPGVEFDSEDCEVIDSLIKEASAQNIQLTEEEAIEKVASDAFSTGYSEMMEKCAEVAYEDGHTEVFEKAAEVAHKEGYMDTMEHYVEKLAEAGETEAVAAMEKSAFDAGYGDAMEKIAGSAFDQGFNDMAQLVQAAQ